MQKVLQLISNNLLIILIMPCDYPAVHSLLNNGSLKLKNAAAHSLINFVFCFDRPQETFLNMPSTWAPICHISLCLTLENINTNTFQTRLQSPIHLPSFSLKLERGPCGTRSGKRARKLNIRHVYLLNKTNSVNFFFHMHPIFIFIFEL